MQLNKNICIAKKIVDEPYISIQKISNNFKVSEVAVRKWVKKGLPHRKEKIIGRRARIVIRKSDVKKFLKLGLSDNIIINS